MRGVPPPAPRRPRLVYGGRLPLRDGLGDGERGIEPESGDGADAERGDVRQRRHLHGDAEQVGLGLHEQRGAGQAAVDAQGGERGAQVGGDRVGELRHLGGDAVAQGAYEMPGGGVEAQAGDRAPQVAPPPRGGEPGERRDEGDTAGVRDAPAHGVDVRGTGDHPEIGEPAHGGGGRVHLPVQAVAGPAGEPPGDTADQSEVLRRGRGPVCASRNAPVP